MMAIGVVMARPVAPNPPPPPSPEPAPAAEPAPPAGPSPHIQFDATELDLGEVVRGQDAVATFTYRNTGAAPLHILSAKPG
jgi:hypothetical protein